MLCLAVDDDDSALSWSQECLKILGFEVLTAKNGIEALEIWKINKPSLIILDWMMPEMDGIQFLKELKLYISTTDDEFPYVIISSAHDEPYHIEEAKDAGATGYLVKPYKARDLEAKIGLLLKMKIKENSQKNEG